MNSNWAMVLVVTLAISNSVSAQDDRPQFGDGLPRPYGNGRELKEPKTYTPPPAPIRGEELKVPQFGVMTERDRLLSFQPMIVDRRDISLKVEPVDGKNVLVIQVRGKTTGIACDNDADEKFIKHCLDYWKSMFSSAYSKPYKIILAPSDHPTKKVETSGTDIPDGPVIAQAKCQEQVAARAVGSESASQIVKALPPAENVPALSLDFDSALKAMAKPAR